jgi:hemoglobin-like flavoprotein
MARYDREARSSHESMEAKMIELLAATFARVAAKREDAGAIFHARLFTTAPELRGSFKGTHDAQKEKLVSLLAQIVEYYRVGMDPQSYLARLARSQPSYGSRRAHFDAVGDALLFTLAQVLGADFTAAIRAVWATAWAEVSSAMLCIGDVPVASLYPPTATARV